MNNASAPAEIASASAQIFSLVETIPFLAHMSRRLTGELIG